MIISREKLALGFLLVCLACFACCRAIAITPEEVFQDGRRAFDLGHWSESKEHFSRFGQAWPGHPLAPQALLMESLSEIRFQPTEDQATKNGRLASLSARLRMFREKLPSSELNELEVSLLLEGSGTTFVGTTTELLFLPPDRLIHLLDRGVIPSASKSPMGTLGWIRDYQRRYSKAYPPGLLGRLAFIKARALWYLCLSPLPARKNMDILKVWGDWPLDKSLNRSLHIAFDQGNLEIKRQAALLGVSADWIFLTPRRTPVPREDSEWMRYLRERGIHEAEAWVEK